LFSEAQESKEFKRGNVRDSRRRNRRCRVVAGSLVVERKEA
jgi:hypothetical protein